MIIDEIYNKFNINKLPRNKYNRGSSTAVTTVYNREDNNITGSTSSGFKPVYLWGNYFDDTKDIDGSIKSTGDIEAQDIHANGNLIAGELPNGYDNTQTGCVYARSIFGNDINATEVNTELLDATTGSIDYLTTYSAIISYLRSQEIRTHNLTVTGQAHFFELVIDQIKSVGGSVLLTPADGFRVAKKTISGNVMTLYFDAYDTVTHKGIRNMWQQDDLALVMNFNGAVQGTSYDVYNVYFWGQVTTVSTNPQYNSVDDKYYHYITIDITSGSYDGSYSNIDTNCDVVMCGNLSDPERQSAIYISAYDGLDDDLKAPFFATYKGIGTLTGTRGETLSTVYDLTHHKYSWFAAGVQTGSTVPANRIVGDLVVESTGQTVDEYIQAQIDATDINMYTAEVDNNIFFQPCASNYMISNFQTFTSTLGIRNNGIKWSINDIAFYLDGTTYYDHTQQNSKIIWNYSVPNQQGTVTFDDSVIPSWYGDNYRYIDAVVSYFTNSTPQETLTKTIRFYFYKLVQGEDGTGSVNPYYIYKLIPVTEKLNVYADGTMKVALSYSLGCSYEVNGSTEQTLVYNVPTGTIVRYRDDRFQTNWQNLTLTNNYFSLTDNNYIQHTAPDGNVYTSYTDLTTHGYNPTYGEVQLVMNNTSIDNKTVPFVFDNGSVFTVKQDAITMAVSNSKTYTDQQINVVTGSMASLTVQVGNINSQVQEHTAQLSGMSGNIVSLTSNYNDLNQWATGTQSTITSIEQVMDPYSGSLAYKNWTQSQILQSASDISLELRNQLETAGIYIDLNGSDSKITLDADNTEITGNLILSTSGTGFSYKDEYNNVRLALLNDSIGVADTHGWTNTSYTKIGIDGFFSGKNGSYIWAGENDMRLACIGGTGTKQKYNIIKVDDTGVYRYDNVKIYDGDSLASINHSGFGDISNTMTVRRITLSENMVNISTPLQLSRDDGFVVIITPDNGWTGKIALPAANQSIGTIIHIKPMCYCLIFSSDDVYKYGTVSTDTTYNYINQGKEITGKCATYISDGISWYEFSSM